jgi:RNA-splicing ligase RtcB
VSSLTFVLYVLEFMQVKAAAESRPGDAIQLVPGSTVASPVQLLSGLVGGNAAYNAKMEEHIKEQQQQLEDAQAAVAAAQAAEGQSRFDQGRKAKC